MINLETLKFPRLLELSTDFREVHKSYQGLETVSDVPDEIRVMGDKLFCRLLNQLATSNEEIIAFEHVINGKSPMTVPQILKAVSIRFPDASLFCEAGSIMAKDNVTMRSVFLTSFRIHYYDQSGTVIPNGSAVNHDQRIAMIQAIIRGVSSAIQLAALLVLLKEKTELEDLEAKLKSSVNKLETQILHMAKERADFKLKAQADAILSQLTRVVWTKNNFISGLEAVSSNINPTLRRHVCRTKVDFGPLESDYIISVDGEKLWWDAGSRLFRPVPKETKESASKQ